MVVNKNMVGNNQRSPIIQLPTPFFDGVCKTFRHGKAHKTWMCFAHEGTNRCQSFDGLNFATEASSSYSHSCTNNLGSYNEAPFITGGLESLKTEMYEPIFGRWIVTADFPFAFES